MQKCKKHKKDYDDNIKPCTSCGDALTKDKQPRLSIKTDNKLSLLKKIKLRWAVSLILIIIAIISVILILSLSTTQNTDGKAASANKNYMLYLKDGEMYYTKLNKIEPKQITHALISKEKLKEYEALGTASLAIGVRAILSQDAKKLFYVDRYDTAEWGFPLYYRDMDKKEAEPIKIDSDVSYYYISEKSDIVTYVKGEEGTLYQNNLKEKTKIANDVQEFLVSDNGTKIVYTTNDDNIYLWNKGKEKEKIASEASLIYISRDLTNIYYIKDETLYIQKEGKERIKVDTDVTHIVKNYASDKFYYIRSEPIKVNVYNYIIDDKKSEDEKILAKGEPEYRNYASYSDYSEAWGKWSEANSRNKNREMINKIDMEIPNYVLYFYDGKEAKKISEHYARSEVSEKSPVIMYSTYDNSKIEKKDISIFWKEDYVRQTVWSNTNKKEVWNVAINEKTSAIDTHNAALCKISDDGSNIFYLDDTNEKEGDLYKITIENNEIKQNELYDSNVGVNVESYFGFIKDNEFIYYKEINDISGDLYINKKCIDYDVYMYGTRYNEKTNDLIYITDYTEKKYGTLKYYNGSKSERIADDVHKFEILPDNSILYLYDYSNTSKTGTLMQYEKNKTEKLEDEVMDIIPLFNYKTAKEYVLSLINL